MQYQIPVRFQRIISIITLNNKINISRYPIFIKRLLLSFLIITLNTLVINIAALILIAYCPLLEKNITIQSTFVIIVYFIQGPGAYLTTFLLYVSFLNEIFYKFVISYIFVALLISSIYNIRSFNENKYLFIILLFICVIVWVSSSIYAIIYLAGLD